MVARARPSGSFHAVEFLAPGAALDAARQAQEPAHADHLQPAARSRLRRSADLPDPAAAQGGNDCARRSLCVHSVRARRRPRRASRMGPPGLRLRAAAGPDHLLPRADRSVAGAPAGRPGQAQVSRSRDGRRTFERPGRELSPVPEPGARDLRRTRRGVRAEHDRSDRRHPRAAADRPPDGSGSAARLPAAAHARRQRSRRSSKIVMALKRNNNWFGHGLPYLARKPLPGHLIAIEGTDGVGRSTQIALLRPWLELEGYAVSDTGWIRSPLLSETINEAKQGHRLTVTTFSLLYAADFADRLEHEILPALQAGFIVIADRYMYTAFARNNVMGADPAWTRDLFGMALVPDLVLYLDVDVDTLVPRVVQGKGMDYWESGMHLALGTDLFDSFIRYQRRLIDEYRRLAD